PRPLPPARPPSPATPKHVKSPGTQVAAPPLPPAALLLWKVTAVSVTGVVLKIAPPAARRCPGEPREVRPCFSARRHRRCRGRPSAPYTTSSHERRTPCRAGRCRRRRPP